MNNKYICLCCGYRGFNKPPYKNIPENVSEQIEKCSPPYRKYWGDPSYDCCACCGYEFGTDDETAGKPGYTFEEYLVDWITEGKMHWILPEDKPANWKLSEQMKVAGLKITPQVSKALQDLEV